MDASSRPKRRVRVAAAVALAAALLATAWWGSARPATIAMAGEAGSDQERPNVVVIMTDDQTASSVSVMGQVQSLLAAKGLTFRNSFASFPLCCPSRATFLTGQYAHNHGVLDNVAPYGGFAKLDSSNTLPVWLQGAGYYTAHIGKYLNGYEAQPQTIPPGWTEWRGSTRTYTFYGYQLNEGGALVDYGSAATDYQTDVYMAKAVELIRQRAPLDTPFFLSLAPLAPHGGGPNPTSPQPPSDCRGTAKPAPRHANSFDAEPLPQSPSFGEADVSDKPSFIQSREPPTAADVADITREYRCRLESLLAVDEGVAAVVGALRDAGELDDTYLIFTSDNGFFHGEHRIKTGKLQLYEESIRVPLIIRGPEIPKGRATSELAVNADLAPTILDAADAEAGRVMDGRSLLPIAADPARERGREVLLETGTARAEDYSAIRTQRYVYAEHTTGERELYDLELDPYQLQSLHADPAYADVARRLAGRLAALRTCAGGRCREAPQLELKLDYRRAEGRRCAANPIKARISGPAAARIDVAEFEVAGDLVRTDLKAPFEDRLPLARFRRRGKTAVGATASLIDGRRLTLERRLLGCR
jgi:N-acetylglucosamine-6-sulfatase